MSRIKKLVLLAMAAGFMYLLTACGNHVKDDGSIQVNYDYPDNPALELRGFLEKNIIKHDLPLTLSDIEEVKVDGEERRQFVIYFTYGKDNACTISFITKESYYSYEQYEQNNPSFTLAFKEPDNQHDMGVVLTSIILYLAPDLSWQEAESLAVDGCSSPLDIGGYQVQAHYANKVSVTALKQIWGGELNLSEYRKLTAPEEFWVLDDYESWRVVVDESTAVYADFAVKDWWQYEDSLHGNIVTMLTVESVHGTEYTLSLDTMRAPYEFAIGKKYTLYIMHSPFGGQIVYAAQLSG